jgi:ubiquinone/menaquinone biosynthesis C-methylase UbiE
MNTKIFSLVLKNLQKSFSLVKYQSLVDEINGNTVIADMPWTPARYRKFKQAIELELDLESTFSGTVENIVDDLDRRYSSRFFGQMWKPRTDQYFYTGWNLVDEINQQNPQSVLDVGCGYHPFKGRIKNLVGIDPYNNCADYMIDILDYRVPDATHDHIIALGSINFNSQEDVELRFAECVRLLTPGGKLYMRCNPGITWTAAPYVDIFPWSFEVAYELAKKYNLTLSTVKKDYDRLAIFFVKS